MSVKDRIEKKAERAQAILDGEREDGGFQKVLEVVEDSANHGYEIAEEDKVIKGKMKMAKEASRQIIDKFDNADENEEAKMIAKAREDADAQRVEIDPDGKVKDKIKEIEDTANTLYGNR